MNGKISGFLKGRNKKEKNRPSSRKQTLINQSANVTVVVALHKKKHFGVNI